MINLETKHNRRRCFSIKNCSSECVFVVIFVVLNEFDRNNHGRLDIDRRPSLSLSTSSASSDSTVSRTRHCCCVVVLLLLRNGLLCIMVEMAVDKCERNVTKIVDDCMKCSKEFTIRFN